MVIHSVDLGDSAVVVEEIGEEVAALETQKDSVVGAVEVMVVDVVAEVEVDQVALEVQEEEVVVDEAAAAAAEDDDQAGAAEAEIEDHSPNRASNQCVVRESKCVY
jgi:hypothetical protein